MNIFHIKANTSLNLQMLYIASAQLRHLYITKTAHKLGNKHKTVFARVSCLIKIIYKITCTQIFIDIYIYIYIYLLSQYFDHISENHVLNRLNDQHMS